MTTKLWPPYSGICVILGSFGHCGCSDPLAGLAASEPERVRVSLVPERPLDAAPSASRLMIEAPAAGLLGPADLRLFEGELSSNYQRRLGQSEEPPALSERRVSMLSWQHQPPVLWAQPSELLTVGATYSLAALGHGLLAEIVVGEPAQPVLRRVWPPRGEAGGAHGALYCSDEAHGLERASLELAPEGIQASMEQSSVEPERCVIMTPDQRVELAVPATELGGLQIDPAALSARGVEPTEPPAECTSACSQLGPGCVCPQDDRVVVHGPEQPSLLHLLVDGYPLRFDTRQRRAQVFVGFASETEYAVRGEAFSVDGARWPVESVVFRTQAPQPHIAINEVYADANGPEPAQEWIELVNSGTVSESLAAYVIEDVGGRTVLPDVVLEPGAFAVVVNADFAPDPELDVAPAASAALVVVQSLGKSGLSNSGELTRLYSAGGEVVSRFPASPKPKPGVSVARRHPWSLDGDPEAFALHSGLGASPGSANQLAAE